MTRETKIGLLIGLGFIVVFAVLLSHTGAPAPRGDGLALGPASKDSPVKLPKSGVPSPGTLATRGAWGLSSSATRPAGRVGLGEVSGGPRGAGDSSSVTSLDERLALLPLPEPRGLVRHRGGSEEAVAEKAVSPWEKILAGAKPAEDGSRVATAEGGGSNVVVQRVAPLRQEVTTVMHPPQVAAPEPGVRPQTPATVQPAAGEADKARQAPPDRQEAPKEYIVQKGDTLRKILKDQYGLSSTKAVAFLVASNKSRIKDKDTIIEGQKLVLPPLPPEMFERAPNFDVSGLGEGIRTVTSEELSRGLGLAADKQRTAPESVKPAGPAEASEAPRAEANVAAVRAAGEGPVKVGTSGYRMVEIRSKDTLRSIAARELGSVNDWEEIQKLNPGVDPRRLQPGMKIRVPAKRPLSSADRGRRGSA